MRILLTLLLAVMVCAPAHASTSIKPTETVNLEVRKGELIKLPRPAASVMIADPAIADIEVKSPTMLYIYGKAVGQTTVFALDDKEGGILGATVKVSHNVSSLSEAVKTMLPDANVKFRSIDGGMVMEGKVNSPVDAADLQRVVGAYMQQSERLINMVQVSGANQVTLRVRVAEVSRSELKNFGINLQAVLNPSNLAFGLATGRPFVEGLLGRLATSNTLVGTTQVGNLDVNSMIDILEDQGLVTTLAEPSLTAITGQTARFLAGGQYPIPVMSQNNTVTIQYQNYGVGLEFTPTVLTRDKISLQVAPTVSALSSLGAISFNGFSIPSLTTRQASTTVELGSGESFAIAGLLQNDSNNDISKFPGLGDIPILGALFRSTNFRRNQSELVIIITPYIVKGVHEQLATPMDGYVPPSDVDRILHGKLHGDAGKPQNDTVAVLKNSVSTKPSAGFVME